MKITTGHGVVSLISESRDEATKLMDIFINETFGKKEPKKAVTHKKHKKHNYSKTCDMCGKVCKGRIGLGIHKRKAHGTIKVRVVEG